MSNDDSYFVMMGDGELAAEVKAAQKALELATSSRFQSRPVTEEFYGILSGLVITALSGDEPVEMYQALGFGVPVFSADVGKARTTLGQYGGGLVVHHDPNIRILQIVLLVEKQRGNLQERCCGNSRID